MVNIIMLIFILTIITFIEIPRLDLFIWQICLVPFYYVYVSHFIKSALTTCEPRKVSRDLVTQSEVSKYDQPWGRLIWQLPPGSVPAARRNALSLRGEVRVGTGGTGQNVA